MVTEYSINHIQIVLGKFFHPIFGIFRPVRNKKQLNFVRLGINAELCQKRKIRTLENIHILYEVHILP